MGKMSRPRITVQALLSFSMVLAFGLSPGFAFGSTDTIGKLGSVMVELSDATLSSVAGDTFLRNEFGSHFAGTSGNSGTSWSGVWITGERVVLNMFSKQSLGVPWFKGGFNLSVDSAGGLTHVDQLVSVNMSERIWRLNQQVLRPNGQPWFKLTRFNTAVPNEYSFFWTAEWNSGPSSNPTDVSRKSLNSSFYQPGRLLKDVTSFTMELDGYDYQTVSEWLQLLGYKSAPTPGGVEYSNSEGTINLILGQMTRVKSVRMSLNSVKSGQSVYNFGDSVLEFSTTGPEAVWSFN